MAPRLQRLLSSARNVRSIRCLRRAMDPWVRVRAFASDSIVGSARIAHSVWEHYPRIDQGTFVARRRR